MPVRTRRATARPGSLKPRPRLLAPVLVLITVPTLMAVLVPTLMAVRVLTLMAVRVVTPMAVHVLKLMVVLMAVKGRALQGF